MKNSNQNGVRDLLRECAEVWDGRCDGLAQLSNLRAHLSIGGRELAIGLLHSHTLVTSVIRHHTHTTNHGLVRLTETREGLIGMHGTIQKGLALARLAQRKLLV